MAITITPCMQSFLKFATGRVRQQIKALLMMQKQLLELELTSLAAKIVRMDVVANTFSQTMDRLQNQYLRPVEAQLAQLPFEEFKTCPELANTVGDIHNIYFEKKSELLRKTYHFAQYGFASNYFLTLRERLQNQLDKTNAYIDYIDGVSVADISPGQSVYVYTQNTDSEGVSYPITRTGVIDSVGLTTVVVTMDDTGANETFSFSDIQLQ